MSERLLFNALLKSDLTSFLYKSFPVIVGGEQLQPNWHHRAICYQLERVLAGEVTRLIIEVPPLMQRLHVDDLAGHLRGQGGWEIVSLPAIAEEDQDIPLAENRKYHRQRGSLLHPQREPQSVLDELRRTIGSYNFSAQYQQEPIPVEGELIKVRWFSSYRDLPSRSDATVVQSWDVGMKGGVGNDYSVCTTWLNDGRNHYLLDVLRGQWEFPELLRQLERAQRHYQADSVLIEDKVTGTPLIQHLKANRPFGFPSPIGINPEGDKVTRIIGESPAIEAGQVFLPELADWLPAFKNEVRQFPNGKHDDQIDSMSQYLKWARRRSGPDFRAMRICGR